MLWVNCKVLVLEGNSGSFLGNGRHGVRVDNAELCQMIGVHYV